VNGESRTSKDAATATNNPIASVRPIVAEIRAAHDVRFGEILRTEICIECYRAKTPSHFRKCDSCHSDYLSGYHRIVGSPFYLAPLEGNR
jgi:ribosomal protein L40E